MSGKGDGQVMNWDRELQTTYVTTAGEPWLNPASESEDSSRSGSEPRADRSGTRSCISMYYIGLYWIWMFQI